MSMKQIHSRFVTSKTQRKLDRNAARLETKRDLETQELINRCKHNVKARQKEENKKWQAEYAASLTSQDLTVKTQPKTSGQQTVIPSPTTFKEKVAGLAAKKSIFDSKWKKFYWDETLEAREKAAIEEAEGRAGAMAPAYNKGAYQPISKNDMHTMGKKI